MTALVGVIFSAVLTAVTFAQIGALNSLLETLAIFLTAATLSAVAAFKVSFFGH